MSMGALDEAAREAMKEVSVSSENPRRDVSLSSIQWCSSMRCAFFQRGRREEVSWRMEVKNVSKDGLPVLAASLAKNRAITPPLIGMNKPLRGH
jgi:hypothetical protein